MKNKQIEELLDSSHLLTKASIEILNSTQEFIGKIDSQEEVEYLKQIMRGVTRIQDASKKIHDVIDYELELRR